MGWKWWSRRMAVLFRKGESERELDEEIAYHIELETRQHIEAGVDPVEARRRALVAFGGVERFKEEVRDVRGARVLDDLVQDARVAMRGFVKQLGFLAAVLLTLGVGIGANVAMFGVLDASLFSALPYPESERLVLGRTTIEGQVTGNVSGADFLDYREESSSFDGLAALTPWRISHTVIGRGDPHRVQSMLISAELFTTLGVNPVLGRSLGGEDGRPGAARTAMLEHGYWLRMHGGAEDIVGQTISVNGTPTEVAGVLPPGFRIVQDVDLFVVWREDDRWAQARQFHNFFLVGRLRPEVELAQAQADVDVISARLAAAFPETNQSKGLALDPLREALIADYRPVLRTLMGAVALVLLIACGNVGGLLLARGSARRAEMSIRSVMGAGKGRLARQLLTENGLLALGAGAFGVFLALWLERGILAFVSLDLLGTVEPTFSARTLGFALALSGATVALFGVVPAWSVARRDRSTELRGGQRLAGSVRGARFRNALVVAQVAATVVLLLGAGVLVRGFVQLRSVETGFDETRLLTAEVMLPSGSYDEPERRVQFFRQLQEGVDALPEVREATFVSLLPIRDPGNNVRIGRPESFGDPVVEHYVAYIRSAWPGYFEAMGIPLLAGRALADSDDTEGNRVIVISAKTARGVFGDEDPLGQTVGVDIGADEPSLHEVVGVVDDVVTSSLASGTAGAMYRPYAQSPSYSMRLAVRTTGQPTTVTAGIRGVLRELDSEVPLSAVATMDDVIQDSLSGQRAITTVLALFASVALLLAALGLYSVLAYQVARRQHEIGIRMALGATVDGVASRVLRGGLRMMAFGLVLGIPAAIGLNRVAAIGLFETTSIDPLTYLGVILFLTLITAVACVLPARRAARIDPVAAFRAE